MCAISRAMDPDPQLFFLLKPDPGVKNVKITEKSNEIDKNCNLTKNVNGFLLLNNLVCLSENRKLFIK